MPGYDTKQQSIAVAGVAGLQIRSLLDLQQYSDPLGAAEALGISSAAWPMFGLLWPSGLRLAERIGQRGLRPGERILELGCGLALASLVAHRGGAEVTASDRHPLAAQFLAHNLRLNGLPPMNYRHGEWALPAAGGARWAGGVHGRYDLLIGSDLLYEREAGPLLAGFIGRHAERHAEVWIVDPDRGNRPGFHRAMATLGFDMTQERLVGSALITETAETADPAASAYKGRLLVYLR